MTTPDMNSDHLITVRENILNSMNSYEPTTDEYAKGMEQLIKIEKILSDYNDKAIAAQKRDDDLAAEAEKNQITLKDFLPMLSPLPAIMAIRFMENNGRLFTTKGMQFVRLLSR